VARRGWPGDELLLGNVRLPASGAAVSLAVAITDAPPSPVTVTVFHAVTASASVAIALGVSFAAGTPAAADIAVPYADRATVPTGSRVSVGLPFPAGPLSSAGVGSSVRIGVADSATISDGSLVRDGIPDAPRRGLADPIGAGSPPDRVAAASADA
jgi:hypothetical protein